MKQVSVSVPGKIMLAGEYSVLNGGRSLSATLKPRLHVDITPREDRHCYLHSELWSQPVDVQKPCVDEKEPLLQSARWACDQWHAKGFDLKVRSELRVSDGFGSSSAVRIAALVALATSLSRSETPWSLACQTWQQQRELQGFASGYDLVTQMTGGAVLWQPNYDAWPGQVSSLLETRILDHFRVFGGGSGAPTKSVGQSTLSWLKENHYVSALSEASDDMIHAFVAGAEKIGWDPLIQAVKRHRDIFEQSPRFPVFLKEALSKLPGFDQTWTFKTTGAGGEDAILLIGSHENTSTASLQLQKIGWNELTSPWSMDGLRVTY